MMYPRRMTQNSATSCHLPKRQPRPILFLDPRLQVPPALTVRWNWGRQTKTRASMPTPNRCSEGFRPQLIRTSTARLSLVSVNGQDGGGANPCLRIRGWCGNFAIGCSTPVSITQSSMPDGHPGTEIYRQRATPYLEVPLPQRSRCWLLSTRSGPSMASSNVPGSEVQRGSIYSFIWPISPSTWSYLVFPKRCAVASKRQHSIRPLTALLRIPRRAMSNWGI